MAMFIVKPWYRKKDDAIYGAEWAGTSDPSWTRTDAAVGFSDPNPYYSGMSTTPSSPFDNIMPWAGMRIVNDASAGVIVEIPKYYFKWTRNGIKMKVEISMTKHDGYLCSPAHADRGDGVGERDYVYVGRYHCASDYKSKTGVTPTHTKTRATFRSGIHALGNNIWQDDFAMFWTVRLLYLVEFATWNSQRAIGYGCGNGSSLEVNGSTDTMPYHTGTMKSSRTTYGVGVQYRYIENLWAQIREFYDGIYFSGNSVYNINNPANFSDTTGGTLTGSRSSDGWIKAWDTPLAVGYEYALYPNAVGGGTDTYITDFTHNESGSVIFFNGGYWAQLEYSGLFYMLGFGNASFTDNGVGSRLMVLPPSRLSA